MAEREHIINKIQELLDEVYKGEKKIKRDYLVATGETGWRIQLNAMWENQTHQDPYYIRYGTLYIIPQQQNIVFRMAHTEDLWHSPVDPVTPFDFMSAHDYNTIQTVTTSETTIGENNPFSLFTKSDIIKSLLVYGAGYELLGSYIYFITEHGENNGSESCGCSN